MKKAVSKFVSILIILGNIGFIFLLLFLFKNSLVYWRNNFPIGYPIEHVSFYVSMLVVITTVIFQWCEGRIETIANAIKHLRQNK